MITIKASNVKERFDDFVVEAHQHPIYVDDSNGGVVNLSQADYSRLQAIEDAVWAQRADDATKRGFAGPAAVDELFVRLERIERDEEIE